MATHTLDIPCVADTYYYNGIRQLYFGNQEEYDSLPVHGMENNIIIEKIISGYNGTGGHDAAFKFQQDHYAHHKKITGVMFNFFMVAECHNKTYYNIIIYDGLHYDGSTLFSEETAKAECDVGQQVMGQAYGLLEMLPWNTNSYVQWEFAIGKDTFFDKIHNGLVNAIYNGQVITIESSHAPENDDFPGVTMQSRHTQHPPFITLTYEDSPPLQPTVIRPTDAYINCNENNICTWKYNAAYGGDQKAYCLQWRQAGTGTWTDIQATSAQSKCVIPANTLQNGNIEWRVKTYNEYDEESPYSEIATCYAIGQPNTPSVFATASALPVISWSATEQAIAEARILDVDGNVIYTSPLLPCNVSSAISGVYLQDGQYTAQARVRNTYGFWSEWGSSYLQVATTKPAPPVISVMSNNAAGIAVRVECAATKCLLYRRERGQALALLGIIKNSLYTDYTATSGVVYEYVARAVDDNNSFADSLPQQGQLNLKCATLGVGDTIVSLAYRLESGYGREYTTGVGRQLTEYIGRIYPAAETDGHRTHAVSCNYIVTPEQYDVLKTMMCAAQVRYRNESGANFCGVISNMTATELHRGVNKRYNITFEVAQTEEALWSN